MLAVAMVLLMVVKTEVKLAAAMVKMMVVA
jgi:hypothetical protein